MQSLSRVFDQHAFAFWIAAILIAVAVALWTLAVSRRTRSIESRLETLFAGATGDNVARMLADYLGTVRTTAAMVERVKAEHDQMQSLFPTVVRHVGLVRFSPFHDTGGDQSFALAVLNGEGDGVVVTALHSRTDSRLYAKPVEGGRSSYSLGPEERSAIEQALGLRPVGTTG